MVQPLNACKNLCPHRESNTFRPSQWFLMSTASRAPLGRKIYFSNNTKIDKVRQYLKPDILRKYTGEAMYYQRNTGARSRHLCCSGKVIGNTFSESVCSLSYSTRNERAPYCHLWSVRLYNIFPHYLINCMIFEKKNYCT